MLMLHHHHKYGLRSTDVMCHSVELVSLACTACWLSSLPSQSINYCNFFSNEDRHSPKCSIEINGQFSDYKISLCERSSLNTMLGCIVNQHQSSPDLSGLRKMFLFARQEKWPGLSWRSDSSDNFRPKQPTCLRLLCPNCSSNPTPAPASSWEMNRFLSGKNKLRAGYELIALQKYWIKVTAELREHEVTRSENL